MSFILNLAACRPLRAAGSLRSGACGTPLRGVHAHRGGRIGVQARQMSEKARKEHLRFHSKDPHVVFDVKKGTDKKQLKKQYYALARKYHPDNVDSGNQLYMNFINAAYAKLTSNDDMGEANEEVDGTGNRRRHSREEDYQAERDAQRERREREEATEEQSHYQSVRDKRDKETKARQAKYDKDNEDKRRRYNLRAGERKNSKLASAYWLNSGKEDRSVQLHDGTWMYVIKGKFYSSDFHVDAIIINYTLVKANYSAEAFERLQLRPVDDIKDSRDVLLAFRDDRDYAQRDVPLLFDADLYPQRAGGGGDTKTRLAFRDSYRFELLFVAGIVYLMVSTLWGYLYEVYRLGDRQFVHRNGEMIARITATRQRREEQERVAQDVDLVLEELETRLESLSAARRDFDNLETHTEEGAEGEGA